MKKKKINRLVLVNGGSPMRSEAWLSFLEEGVYKNLSKALVDVLNSMRPSPVLNSEPSASNPNESSSSVRSRAMKIPKAEGLKESPGKNDEKQTELSQNERATTDTSNFSSSTFHECVFNITTAYFISGDDRRLVLPENTKRGSSGV